MITVLQGERMNLNEVMIVRENLRRRGIVWATIQPGNQCIWVSWGHNPYPISEYFIFRHGRLVDCQID